MTNSLLTRTLPKRVNFKDDRKDREVILLATYGASLNTICTHTGYSLSQVSYRLHKAGISPMSWRKGQARHYRSLITTIESQTQMARRLLDELEARLRKDRK